MSTEKQVNIITFMTAIMLLNIVVNLLIPFVHADTKQVLAEDFAESKVQSVIGRWLTNSEYGVDKANADSGFISTNKNRDAKSLIKDEKEPADGFTLLDAFLAIKEMLLLLVDLTGIAVAGGLILMATLYVETAKSFLLTIIVTLFFLPLNIIATIQIGKLVLTRGRL